MCAKPSRSPPSPAISFVVFPGVDPFSYKYQSTVHNVSLTDAWWQIILLATFTTFDWVGRAAPALFVAASGWGILALAASRVLLLPIMIGGARGWMPQVTNDIVNFATMVVFATSNGYFASLAMMEGPTKVPAKDKERAGFLMALALQGGILTGTLVSQALV